MIAAYHLRVTLQGRAQPLFDDATFEIPERSWAQIVGESAQGKSVLFDLLSLRVAPTHGKLIVAGHNMTRQGQLKLAQVRQRLGCCAQRDELLGARTLRENLLIPFVVRQRPAQGPAQVEAALEQLAMTTLGDVLVKDLCPQERRAAQIAQALMAQPDVVLIDGGLEGLEDPMRRRLMVMLRERYREGSTVILLSRQAIPMMGVRVLELRLERGQLHTVERLSPARSPEAQGPRR